MTGDSAFTQAYDLVAAPAAGLPGVATQTGLTLPETLSHEQWREIGVCLQAAERSLMWWIGDWLRFGERHWGEMYREAITATGAAYQTLRDAKWVAERYQLSCRHDNLSWTHHREAAALDPDIADDLLNRAEIENWSAHDMRAAVHRVRNVTAIAVPAVVANTCVTDSLQRLIESGQRFGCIYADPPWPYDNQGTRAATGNHYASMSLADICALPVAKLAADKAHLHLWTTNSFLFDAKPVIDAWGFDYCSCCEWVKPDIGLGNYWRNANEHLLLGVRGNLPFAVHDMRSWAEYARTEHSAKPEQMREKIMRASPGPYLELFARRAVEGWTVWGDQIEPGLFPTGVVA